MNLTKHAQLRMSQRAIAEEAIAFARHFGHVLHRAGATFYTVRRKDLTAALLRTHGHLVGLTVLVTAKGDTVLTCYKHARATRRIKSKPRCSWQRPGS
ncbi:MAG: hypothetical protein VKO64_11255 [Candidatus Sericytochromatia bacterium]|nr:hypothetical protein [Candidatus Sericytochromatia bacterium]